MKRLLFLLTGGTISMVPGSSGLAPSPSFPEVLRAFVAGQVSARVQVQALGEPIDSSNATPHDWRHIARVLVECWGSHDAFVVLHGTDTLAFTASALAFMLGRGIDKPVLVTGAQRHWAAEDSDGPGKVCLAVRAAQSLPGGVAVAFGGRVLNGARATKVSSTADAAFDSPNAPWLSVQGEAHPVEAGDEAFEPSLPPIGEADVALVHCLPGMSVRGLNSVLDAGPAAVLLNCFGGATLPSLGGAMREFLKRAREQGAALGAICQVPHGGLHMGAYAAGQLLTEYGVADGRDMTLEAAHAKLIHLVALGLDVRQIEARFGRSLVGELSYKE